jgi:hypothetical protein
MAVMLYAIRCLSENDQHALRNMNFGPEEVAALRELNLADCMCRRISAVICRGPIARVRLSSEHGPGTTPEGKAEVVSLG